MGDIFQKLVDGGAKLTLNDDVGSAKWQETSK